MLLTLATEAAPSDTGWPAVVGIAITFVLGPLVTVYVTSRTARGKSPAAPTPSVSVPDTGTGENVHAAPGMSSSQLDVFADMSSTLTWLRGEVTTLKGDVAAGRAHSAQQDGRINLLEGRLAEAIDDLDRVHTWIEDGMPNPPGAPGRPAYAPKASPNRLH